MKRSYRFKITAIILGIISLVLVISIWSGFNGLVRKDADVDLKMSAIKSKLQLRHDALTQMIGAIDGLEEYAITIWQGITDARQTYSDNKNSNDPGDINDADIAVTEALYNLLVLVEDNRPAGVSVDSLYAGYMDSVLSMEYQLDVARQDYNQAVTKFNVKIKLFPTLLYARILGFSTSRPLWEIAPSASEIPSFNN